MFKHVGFLGDVRGNIAIIFALTLPVLLVCMGMAVDYGVWVHQKQELQRIADQAALIATRELYMANSTASQTASTATAAASKQMVSEGMMTMADADMMMASATESSTSTSSSSNTSDDSGKDTPPGPGDNPTTFGNGYSLKTNVDIAEGSVEVVLRQMGVGFFSTNILTPPVIQVTAVARAMGGGRVCVIGLNETEPGAITLDSNARLTAETCGVYSNSSHVDGIRSNSNAVLTAELTCSVGGYDGNSYNFTPAPITDCPPIDDPLGERPAPAVGSCDYNDRTIVDEIVDLSPGVYCGGLLIDGNSIVHLTPGVYIIKDGPFSVDSNSEVRGEHVGFYLTGADTVFSFDSNAFVDLSAPAEGPLAGILFFEDRSAPLDRAHEIHSNYARNLVGTVYLSRGRFVVDADTPVADQSAYTAIVARQVVLDKGPNLVLNTDYALTDVPLPSGINRIGGTIVLTQ